MKFLVCANTPDQVHTFRNLVDELRGRGHQVLILARDYTCTVDLLDYYDLPYRVYGSHDTGRYSAGRFLRELPAHLARIARYTHSFDPDVVFGRGPYAAFAGTLADARTNLVLDSEPNDRLHRLSRPFADLIVSPEVSDVDLRENHYTFRGFKECAYLHPDTYTPDPTVREALGVGDDPFVLVRLNSLDALHDLDEEALTRDQRHRLIEALSEEATVIVSDESGDMDLSGLDASRYDVHPGRIHDVLAEAELVVAETGTMVIESAFLGTPAIACSPFAEEGPGEFVALENHGLIRSTTDYDAILECARHVLAGDVQRAIPLDDPPVDDFERRRELFAEDLVDLTALLVEIATATGDSPDVEGLVPRSARLDGDRLNDAPTS
jgi:hypothetical protein